MTNWYLSYDGSKEGPLDQSAAAAMARANPNGHAWRDGFTDWLPISQIGELSGDASYTTTPPPVRPNRRADLIDFRICGSEMQYVEILLDDGESVVAEAGSMMFKTASVQMESVLGGATSSGGAAGLMEKFLAVGKRLVTGESIFVTVFTHAGPGQGVVAFAAPYPGNIVPLDLTSVGGSFICQKDSFLCAAKGVSIGIFLQRKILTGLFGGEGFIMQQLEGDGMVFLHAGGTVVEKALGPGERLQVDTGCVVGFESSVDFSIEQAGSIRTALFGGEGLFLASLSGPGRVWLQSLPFSRLAGRMMLGAGRGKEEGSVLGKIGLLVQGDIS